MTKNDLVPNWGVSYKEAKDAAQQIANERQKEVKLWFNVDDKNPPETIKPEIKNK